MKKEGVRSIFVDIENLASEIFLKKVGSKGNFCRYWRQGQCYEMSKIQLLAASPPQELERGACRAPNF